MVNEDKNIFVDGNTEKSSEGNEFQKYIFDKTDNFFLSENLVKGVDFDITNNENLYVYRNRYNKLLNISLEELVKQVNSLEEVLSAAEYSENFEVFKNDLRDIEVYNLDDLKKFIDRHSRCDVKFWLKSIPKVVFVIETSLSARNDRVSGKKWQASDIVLALKYLGYQVVYILLLPNNEYIIKKYSDSEAEFAQLNTAFKDINKEVISKKGEGYIDPINIAIQENKLFDFLNFILTSGCINAKDIIKEYKRSRGLKKYFD